MEPLSDQHIQTAVYNPDSDTSDYAISETMYRVTNPEESLRFYTKILGMRLITHMHFTELRQSAYFLGYPPQIKNSGTIALELLHHWGQEHGQLHNGNSEPLGFGHIGITVPDLNKACTRFELEGVHFIKKPEEGSFKGLAMIRDPDGYWIEVTSKEAFQSAFSQAPLPLQQG